eukprot:TRINITY_DN35759_c0_g1_i1.p1 TRINITY_DN35759_c0_g1~~TRINITY_DN35759_c0_g1_i1.p1  ORF type:complete len:546 (-),score=120.60 TRINITY_DN35759_c0_g1_i1:60-1697(-)
MASPPQKRRRLSLTTTEEAANSPADKVADWRTGDFSDWTLIIGSESYKVHRLVLGSGARSSAFLERAFSSEAFCSAGARTTDLSGIIPETCAGRTVSAALDFAYNGSLPADMLTSGKDLVKLCKIGDALQIRALLAVCVEALDSEGIINEESVFEVSHTLSQVDGLGLNLQSQLEDIITATVAANLNKYTLEDLSKLAPNVLQDILSSPDLRVPSEDQMFRLVRQVARRVPDFQARRRLWQKVRFGQLSAACLLEAATIDDIPRELFVFLTVANAFLPKELPKGFASDSDVLSFPPSVVNLCRDWAGAHHFFPRGYLSGISCAYVYSLEDDFSTHEILREQFKGRLICKDLEDCDCKVEFINAAAVLESKVLHKFDIVILSELYDTANMPAANKRLLQDFVNLGLGGMLVLDCEMDILNRLKVPCRTFTGEFCYEAGELQEKIVLEDIHHPILQSLVGPESYPYPLMKARGVKVADSARILARSVGGQPEIVESANKRVLSFLSLLHIAYSHGSVKSRNWSASPQFHQLLRRAVVHLRSQLNKPQ